MALSARVPSTAGTNLYVPAIYVNKVIEATKSDLVAWDAINAEWTSGMAKGNIYYIPKTNVITASEVVVGTKGTTLNPINTTGVTLTINEWWQAPVDVDYMTIEQTHINPEDWAVTEAAYAVRVKIDSTVCALFYLLNSDGTGVQGSDGQTLTDDLLLTIKQIMDEGNVPLDNNRSLILDPSSLSDMLKIDKFVAANYVQMGAISNGIIGTSPIYGCKVRVTNNLTAVSVGSYGVMMHKNAIAGKAQIQKAWVKEYEDLHLRRYHSEALWGVAEAQDAFGVPFYTRHA